MNQQERILIYGRLGKNPDLRYTRKQEPVCQFTVAENIEGETSPRWHRVVVWGKQAELCTVYLKKGSPIFVQGQIFDREFTTDEGEKKQYRELNADNLGFLAL